MRKLIVKFINALGLRPFFKKTYRAFNYVYRKEVNGKIFFIPQIYGANCVVDEWWMIDLLKIIFQHKKGAFLDIGVNLGQTLLKVKSIDLLKDYVGFEPNASCVFYTEELIRINKLQNVKLIPAGLSDREVVTELNLYDDNITNSGGSVVKDYWTYKNYVPKRSLFVSLFSFSKVKQSLELPKFDTVKIDVEGAELEVLQSLLPDIIESRPILIVEVLSAYSSENVLRVSRQNEIEQLLKSINYKILQIINNEASIIRIESINGFRFNDDPNFCNYLFYPEEEEMTWISTFSEVKIKMVL